jgi:hypothetical protein
MRDLYFRPTRTLSEYTRLAERDGRSRTEYSLL